MRKEGIRFGINAKCQGDNDDSVSAKKAGCYAHFRVELEALATAKLCEEDGERKGKAPIGGPLWSERARKREGRERLTCGHREARERKGAAGLGS